MMFSPVSGMHRVGSFLHAHKRHVPVPHAALAVGYASTVVAGPVGYTLVGVAYIVAVVFDVRETRHVKPAHVGLAVAYVVTVVLYPVLHASGIAVVGAAYAFSALAESEEHKRG